jgi:hypothetical protein
MWAFGPLKFTVEHPLSEKVIAAARSIIGQKEIPGNKGFVDPVFEKRMKDTGWNKGESWCCYTTELIWKTAFTTSHYLYEEIDKLFSGSAVKTFSNFKDSPHFETGPTPRHGAISIFRHGKGWEGHAGIVIPVIDINTFHNVEGNTNASGGREGIEVAEKIRHLNEPFKANGLNIEGFIYLPAA